MASCKGRPSVVPPTNTKVVFAAIDFGTFCSGYAFAFRHEPLKIYTNAWKRDRGVALTTAKAPTTVLLRPDKTFHSFGFEAEEKYAALAEDDEHEGWYYFKQFKMELYRNEKLSRETMLSDIENKEMPAMKIFTLVIKNLKENLLSDVKGNDSELNADDIFWILTVPAIWSDAAKQFMRESANRAGITNDQLRLVLEPEAASLYCQTNCSRKVIQSGIVELTPLPAGHKYIVADMGGGTVDIATHEVLEDGNLREIYRATGDELGACKVDLAFTRFLTTLFGNTVMKKFHKCYRGDFLDIMGEFEHQKKSFHFDDTKCMTLKFPAALRDCLNSERNMTPEKCIETENCTSFVEMKRDKIKFYPKLLAIFFNEPVKQIVEKIKEILAAEGEGVDALMLVGGFAESPFIKATVARKFPNLKLKMPEEAGLHVLKGAVLTIARNERITERIARYSYGFRTAEKFDESKHPSNLQDVRRSGVYCSDIFHKCIEKGQNLRFGEEIQVEFGGNKLSKDRKLESQVTELYRSIKTSPQFCTENEGCMRVAQIKMNMPVGGWPDKVEFVAKITVGETELRITVIDKLTKKSYESTVDFLQN